MMRERYNVEFSSDGREARRVYAPEGFTAHLISSRLEGYAEETHAPVLDIDLPAQLIPSSTEGHFHLYIDKAMSWTDYGKLLNVLADVGIIEEGYARASLERKATFVRAPGVTKADCPLPSSEEGR